MVNKRTVIVLVGVILIGAMGVMYALAMRPYWTTQSRLNEQVRVCYKNRADLPKELELDVLDGWGNPLVYSRQASPNLIVHGVVSRGPDGILNTDDDMVVVKTDLNKSKIIGKWTGDKAREALRGFLDGFHRDSEFDED